VQFLANENMPGSVIRTLRERGHDVLSAKESMRGADDEAILARAQAESRILLSQDKDFGELAYRVGLPASCGVVLFRLDADDPETIHRRMIEVIESRTDWAGQFTVADDYRIRMRPLPGANP
jgi:predicted nuclease of predicted toxin-antitoxin system